MEASGLVNGSLEREREGERVTVTILPAADSDGTIGLARCAALDPEREGTGIRFTLEYE